MFITQRYRVVSPPPPPGGRGIFPIPLLTIVPKYLGEGESHQFLLALPLLLIDIALQITSDQELTHLLQLIYFPWNTVSD